MAGFDTCSQILGAIIIYHYEKFSTKRWMNMTGQMSQTTLPDSWPYIHSDKKQSETGLWDVKTLIR